MRQSDALGSSCHKAAVYKGLKVDVFTVDKTEISLTRQDLVELINVRVLLNNFFHYNVRFLLFSPDLLAIDNK